jgi:hypothetical protein
MTAAVYQEALSLAREDAMPVQDATAANTALWSHYLEHEWPRLLASFVPPSSVEAAAAGMSAWLALISAPTIAWMFGVNAPRVSQFMAEERTRLVRQLIPEDFRAHAPGVAAPASPVEEEPQPVEDAAAVSVAR